MTDTDWKKKLTPDQYNVCREGGTEPAFSGEFNNHKEAGLYTCACCETKLFSSDTKYDSGSGWPSFYEPLKEDSKDNIAERPDTSKGKVRTEVLCKQCQSHLGHVFTDGPQPTGQRYCINSLSLKFKPKEN